MKRNYFKKFLRPFRFKKGLHLKVTIENDKAVFEYDSSDHLALPLHECFVKFVLLSKDLYEGR